MAACSRRCQTREWWEENGATEVSLYVNDEGKLEAGTCLRTPKDLINEIISEGRPSVWCGDGSERADFELVRLEDRSQVSTVESTLYRYATALSAEIDPYIDRVRQGASLPSNEPQG